MTHAHTCTGTVKLRLVSKLFLLALLNDIRFSDDWIGLLEVAEHRSGALRQHYTFDCVFMPPSKAASKSDCVIRHC